MNGAVAAHCMLTMWQVTHHGHGGRPATHTKHSLVKWRQVLMTALLLLPALLKPSVSFAAACRPRRRTIQHAG